MSKQDTDTDAKRPMIDAKTIIIGLISLLVAMCAWWAKDINDKVDQLTCDMSSVKTALGIGSDKDTCKGDTP